MKFTSSISHARRSSSVHLPISRCISASQGTISTVRLSMASSVESLRHQLPDGMNLELLRCAPAKPTSKPPLLMIHGSYHGAWCWSENFLPYFSEKGYDAYAVSLRAQGNSDRGNLKVSGTLASHADDLSSVIQSLPSPPVIIGHSFGGLLVEKYAVTSDARPNIAGIACLSAVPPTGNAGIVARISKRSLWDSAKITWGFISKSFAKNVEDCRWLFFPDDMPESILKIYQAKLAACSPARLLDLRALNEELPVTWKGGAPPNELKAFVGGGGSDRVVDIEAVHELAQFFNVPPRIWDGAAHDVMLDTRWRLVADDLLEWLDTL